MVSALPTFKPTTKDSQLLIHARYYGSTSNGAVTKRVHTLANRSGRSPRLESLMGGKLLQPYIHDGVNHRLLPPNKSLRRWASGRWKGDIVAFRKGLRHELVNLTPSDRGIVDYAVKRSEMKHMDPRVRQFLDMEAQVEEDGFSDEEDEAEERDREDAFIDDGTALDNEDSMLPANLSVHHHSEDALELLISRIDARIDARRNTSGHRIYTVDDVPETNLDKELVYIPREGDYPLWRIECLFGVEDLAVVSLLNSVAEQHQVRSAFTQGSVRGCIYVECKMNEHLIKLLLLMPGILRNRSGLKSRIVDPSEYAGLFRMRDGHKIVEVGSWVIIKKGLYKGDVGIVSQKSSLGARILLIPQLDTTSQNPLKRKASTVRPLPKLFDPDHFRQLFPSHVVVHEHGQHSFGQLQFEQGLLAKDFDYHSFTVNVEDMSFDCYTIIRRSKHPSITLSNMPRPREWSMKQNDRVLIHIRRSETTITFVPAVLNALNTLYAEVEQILEHDGPSGGSQEHSLLSRVSWQDLRKEIKVEEYVCVRGGLHAGKKGWVVQVEDEQVSIASKKIEGDIYEHLKDIAMEFFEVLANFLEVTEEPAVLHYKREPESGPLPPSTPRHPWCGVKVKISKKHHPCKGETGQIFDVIEKHEEKIVMLNVQLMRYDPNAPFHKITLHYDDVVELSTYYELVHFLDPGENHIRPTPKQQLPNFHATHLSDRPSEQPSGCDTPLPMPIQLSSSALSPAWDPSSRTPLDSRTTQSWLSDSWTPPVLRPPSLTHVLLNPKLVGCKFNAVVDGGGFTNQQIAVSVDLEDSRVVLRHKKYHTWILLQPGWVTPKHPNPTHDNGLLAVIKGEHCGKYVRRIHHRRGADLATTITIILKARHINTGLNSAPPLNNTRSQASRHKAAAVPDDVTMENVESVVELDDQKETVKPDTRYGCNQELATQLKEYEGGIVQLNGLLNAEISRRNELELTLESYRDELEVLKSSLNAERQQSDTTKMRLKVESSQMEKMLAGYKNQVNALESSLNDDRLRLEQMDATKKQLENIIPPCRLRLLSGAAAADFDGVVTSPIQPQESRANCSVPRIIKSTKIDNRERTYELDIRPLMLKQRPFLFISGV
ncbi:hypothetical protein CVT25_015172 [Psilocybe cyanescens]|uniref:Chromatin elongation factor SPT5 n=1 Tax=Psilocybe cyanescens TaxID=93625 RepID=A0A409XAJ8_PSICY|nr:hypothetical protein CVT25_015172 [Psilocybe cyanescens]